MNKNILIGLVAVVIIGAGLFVLKSNQKAPQTIQDTLQNVDLESESSDNSAMGSIKGNIQDLFAQGKSMKCTFSHTGPEGGMSGTVYVSGNNVRGDYKVVQESGETVESSMIQDGTYVYTWTNMQEKGMKMKIVEPDMEDTEAMESGDYETGQADFDYGQMNMDYNCEPWNLDASVFALPQNIEFVDFNAQLEEQFEDQCATCDQIPEGDAREQCKEALGCL